MEAIFLKILNMSITASWLVLAIVILRLILKKAPKAISVFMWALVGVRLICPLKELNDIENRLWAELKPGDK